MPLEETLQIKNNEISILVTVSWIYSDSKTHKCMIMYNLTSSRGTMTRILTLQVPKNRQHGTSLQLIQPNQDYVSSLPPIRELSSSITYILDNTK